MRAIGAAYDDDCSPVFMAFIAERTDGRHAGPVFRQHNGTPFDRIDGQPASAHAEQIGTASLQLTAADTATFTYAVGDAQATKPMPRLQFGSAVSHCTPTMLPGT